jgi:hypothetical protein
MTRGTWVKARGLEDRNPFTLLVVQEATYVWLQYSPVINGSNKSINMGDKRMSNSWKLKLVYQHFRWTHCIHFPGKKFLWNISSYLHSKCHSSVTYNDYTSWLHTWETGGILHPLTCIKQTLEKHEERNSEGGRGGGEGGHISDKFLCSSDN